MAKKKRKRVSTKQLAALRDKGADVKYQPREVVATQFDELIKVMKDVETVRDKAHKDLLAQMQRLTATVSAVAAPREDLAEIRASLVRIEKLLLVTREPVDYDFTFDREMNGFTKKVRARHVPNRKH